MRRTQWEESGGVGSQACRGPAKSDAAASRGILIKLGPWSPKIVLENNSAPPLPREGRKEGRRAVPPFVARYQQTLVLSQRVPWNCREIGRSLHVPRLPAASSAARPASQFRGGFLAILEGTLNGPPSFGRGSWRSWRGLLLNEPQVPRGVPGDFGGDSSTDPQSYTPLNN